MTATSTPPKGRLYIRLAPSSLCFARYDAREPADLGFCSYRLRPQTSLTANLREAVRTASLLDDARRESAQLFVCGPFTLVPLTDFQEEDCAGLYDACFPSQQKRQVFYDVVPEANCVVLFALEEAACRAFADIFPKVYYVSAFTPVLRHFAAKGAGSRAGSASSYICTNRRPPSWCSRAPACFAPTPSTPLPLPTPLIMPWPWPASWAPASCP